MTDTGAADTATADTGTAYGIKPGAFDESLTRVGPGTPMGELFRRYWHAVGRSAAVGTTPQMVRVLGEDLVVFRDRSGDVGLLYPRCAHRGTTLLYGKVEEVGIRCCYHGWQFDTQGYCIDQPVEPDGGLHKDRYRQPWYPVREYHGLVFAYMGPPERKPAFPLYQELEDLVPGERIVTDDDSFGSGGAGLIDCNWLQHTENVLDPAHLPVLHSMISGPQFGAPVPITRSLTHPDYEFTEVGVASTSERILANGRVTRNVIEVVMPALRLVPNPRRSIQDGVAESDCDIFGWITPVDDTHYRIFSLGKFPEGADFSTSRTTMHGKAWADLTPQEHRDYPGDYEAQTGQGPITLHSEEHLASTDRGVSMLRSFYRRQITAIGRGEDPAGVVVGPETVRTRVRASRHVVAAPADAEYSGTPERSAAPEGATVGSGPRG